MSERLPIHGLMAEFPNPHEFVAAIHAIKDAGYTRFDAYSPLPLEEAAEAMGLHGSLLPKLVLCGGIVGGLFGYGLAYWTSVIDYPLNVGGRPLHSWPAYIPVVFECIILFAALTVIFGMLGLNGLPQPYHPVFNVKRFALASKDRFFVCIESTDPKFHIDDTWRFLLRLEPRQVSEVES